MKKKKSSLVIKIELHKENDRLINSPQYKFKDEGYIEVFYSNHRNYNKGYGFTMGGLTTPEQLKLILGIKQWDKFCRGKRLFILN